MLGEGRVEEEGVPSRANVWEVQKQGGAWHTRRAAGYRVGEADEVW